MNKKRKGFSIAELLIALLIISIVLAAAIPTITKKNSAAGEKIWRWAGTNNSAYFGVGANQSAIIGASQMPFANVSDNEKPKQVFVMDDIDPSNVNFTTDGDKLVLIKRAPEGTDKGSGKNVLDNFINSHISFYYLRNGADATAADDVTYAGRLNLDQHNIALGIGTLQHMVQVETDNSDTAFKGYNTALGHYSLFYNTEGQWNTAVGEKALAFNVDGNDNTAVGYATMSGKSENSGSDSGVSPYNSTALGAYALQTNNGNNNTAVGISSLSASTGSFNTAIGANSCRNLKGDYNICIGYNAGVTKDEDTEDSSDEGGYGFYLGIKTAEENVAEAPLLEGHTSRNGTSGVKDLIANVDNFQIRTQDSSGSIFNVDALSTKAGGVNGRFSFIFRDPRKTNSIASVLTLQERCGSGAIDADICSTTAGNVLFMTSDIGKSFRNISFNDILKIVFPVNAGDTTKTVKFNISDSVLLDQGGKVQASLLELNNNVLIDREAKFKLNITSANGFLLQSIEDGNNPFDVIKAQGTTLNINAKDNLTFDGGKNYINLYSKAGARIAIQGQESNGITLNSDGLIQAGNLILSQLASHAQGNLKIIIDDLYSKLSTASDVRLKNISGDNTAGLKEITALEIKNYTYKNDKKKTPHVGVIAQQLQKIFPNSVFKGDDGYLRITKDEMFYALINSVKELLAKIQDLTAKITGLDKRITELEKQNQILKNQNAEFEKRLSQLEKKAK